jgi:hypothetical protein
MTFLRWTLVTVLLVVLLAGCAGDGAAPAAATPQAGSSSGTPTSVLLGLPTTTPVAAGISPAAFWGVSPAAVSGECPQAGEWPLYYWRGPELQISLATAACPTADRYWARRNADWMAFATGVPEFAVDDFRVVTGEALFIRGKR